MAQWFEIEESKRTPEQVKQAQQAYYEGLLSSSLAQQMVCDMRRRVREPLHGSAHDPNLAVAQLWLEAFVEDSLTIAGVIDDARLVGAMAPIAHSWTPPKEQKPDVPRGYAER